MTQTTFTDNVAVQGSRDIPQLDVKAYSTQTQPIQKWSTSGSIVKAQITPEGRLQVVDTLTPGLVSDALIQANGDVTLPSSQVPSGLHTIGRVQGTIPGGTNWVTHELKLDGAGDVSGLQTGSRHKLTYSSTGNATSAELRATDTQAINEKGTSSQRIGRLAALRASISNAANAFLNSTTAVEAAISNDTGANINRAVGVEVLTPTNVGTIGQLYGLRVNDLGAAGGTITNYAALSIDNEMELKVQTITPPKSPPTGFIKLYSKMAGSLPKLYAKDSASVEYDLTSRNRQAVTWYVPNNSGTYGTSSPTFVDLNPTVLTITIPVTTGAILMGFSAVGYVGSGSNGADFDFTVDGNRVTLGASGLGTYDFPGTATPYNTTISLTAMKTQLSVGDHTIRVQHRAADSPTANYMYAGSNSPNSDFSTHFWVMEI